MGNSCACDIACRGKDIFDSDLRMKPSNSTVQGSSLIEEEFITQNSNFHNTNFSKLIAESQTKQKPSVEMDYLDVQRLNESRFSNLDKSYQTPIKEFTYDLVVEGELEKYRPGLDQKFTTRWCRLTNEGFAYYKNQWAAACFKKPLNFIPLSRIKRINVTENRIQKKNPELFEFEICLYRENSTGKASRSSVSVTRVGENVTKVSPYWWNDRKLELVNSQSKLIFGIKDIKSFKYWVKNFESLLNL